MEMTTATHSLDELNRQYSDGESVDSDIFAEMKSNVLLYAGDHYTRKSSSFYKRIRDSKELSNEQKVRLTKNHTQFICDSIVNNIVAPNPGVGFEPKNEKEVHDQKAAQLHHAVWRDAHEKYHIDDLIDDWSDSFVQLGEVTTKIYFDPNKGAVKAYNQKANENGEPLFLHPFAGEVTQNVDEMGAPLSPAPDEQSPIFWGEFIFEEIYGFNLIRPSECKDLRQAEYLITRKMVKIKDLQEQFPDKADKITPKVDQTYTVFDSAKGGYEKVKDQTLLREHYFRPCHRYPKGYFYFATQDVILAEGELPGGIFPIVTKPYRKFPTAPRGRSPIKTIRPYQAEINRSASKIAEHQITLGDDKLLIQNGTKVSAGASLPGVRSVNYTGAEPKILNGRDGSQYVNYMISQIQELYQVLGVREDTEELPAQLDAYVMLFRSARQKKKFQRNIKRFENFLIQVVKTYLQLAKIHLPDDYLVHAVGSTERVNIVEFRELPDTNFDVTITAQSDDVETKLGKQIVLNNLLQYGGKYLKPEDVGKIIRQMPYANVDQSFDDLTIDYDNAVNDILALDRGEMPPINQYDNHVYCIKRLVARVRKSDFKTLPPQVQQNYHDKIAMHQQFEAQNQLALQRAKAGYIPTGGYLATVDLYVPDPADPSKPKKLRLPSETIQWTLKMLETQQAGLAPIMDMNQGAQVQMAEAMQNLQQPDVTSGVMSPDLQSSINQMAVSG